MRVDVTKEIINLRIKDHQLSFEQQLIFVNEEVARELWYINLAYLEKKMRPHIETWFAP